MGVLYHIQEFACRIKLYLPMIVIGLDYIPLIDCQPSVSLPHTPISVSFTFQINFLHSNPCLRICFWGTYSIHHFQLQIWFSSQGPVNRLPHPHLPCHLIQKVRYQSPQLLLVSSIIKSCWFYVLSTTWLKFQPFLSAGTTLTQTLINAIVSLTWFSCCQSHLSPISASHPPLQWSFLNPNLPWSLTPLLLVLQWLPIDYKKLLYRTEQGSQLTPTFFLPPFANILHRLYSRLIKYLQPPLYPSFGACYSLHL